MLLCTASLTKYGILGHLKTFVAVANKLLIRRKKDAKERENAS